MVKKEIQVPNDFEVALSLDKDAKVTFDSLSPSHKREYLEWITDAKAEETRKRRIEKAILMIKEPKA